MVNPNRLSPILCCIQPQLLRSNQFKCAELRAQFAEQLRSLETRTETQVALLTELYEFFKRRADIEYDHGKHVAKMGKQLAHKAKANKEK